MSRDDKYRQATPNQREILADLLYTATEVGTKELGCTGVSFVTSSIGYWAFELGELDPAQAAKFFRAIADQVEARSPVGDSEERRRAALQVLFQKAADQGLAEDPAQGSA